MVIARTFPALIVAALLVPALPAAAQSDLARGARAFVEQQALPPGGEIEIVVGEPDTRLALAPCARFEPFVPRGAKLWGRSSLGVRCVEGANWTVYVPIDVRVLASVQVAARPIPRGAPVGADDIRIERIDVTRTPSPPLSADEAIEGLVAARPIAAGEPLRRDLLKAPPIVAAGDPVKIVYDGQGFAVSIDGKALAPAGDGQSVRVSTANGRILTGTARTGHVVVIR
jgi:flagella basal body P-ring formation protein FlgA